MKIKRRIIISVAVILVAVIGIYILLNKVASKPYKVFQSPDNKYQLEVYTYMFSLYIMVPPGQGSDVPGVVFLKDEYGNVLQRCNVEMVQLVEYPEWTDKTVCVKLILDWKLPE